MRSAWYVRTHEHGIKVLPRFCENVGSDVRIKLAWLKRTAAINTMKKSSLSQLKQGVAIQAQ